MENVETINNEMDVNNGTQSQIPDHYNRQIVRQVANGKVSVPLERTLEENYGKDFVEKYKDVLKNSEDNKKSDRRSVINLSAYIRAKENAEANSEAVSETPAPVEEETINPNKEYYLKILQRRLDLIEEKYGIKFDPKLVEYFKSDEYFETGNIDFLEGYES